MRVQLVHFYVKCAFFALSFLQLVAEVHGLVLEPGAFFQRCLALGLPWFF